MLYAQLLGVKSAKMAAVIAGNRFHKGRVYVPDSEAYFNKLSPEKQKEELEFREEAKKHLPKWEAKFKEDYCLY